MCKRNILGQLLPMFSLLGSLILAACAGNDPASLTAGLSPENALVQPAATMAVSTRPLLEPSSSPKPSLQAASPAGSTAETAEPPPVPAAAKIRAELKATDPSKVALASGQMQLVEFFAFW